jgi:hypothetical protein
MENKPWKSSTYYHVLPDFFSSISCKQEIQLFPAIKELLMIEHKEMNFQKGEEFNRTFFKVRVKDLFSKENHNNSWFSFDEIVRKAEEQGLKQLSVTSMMHLLSEVKNDNLSPTTRWQKGEGAFISVTPIEDCDAYKLLSFDCSEKGSVRLGVKSLL